MNALQTGRSDKPCDRNDFANWHALCNHPGIGGRIVRVAAAKGKTVMSFRLEAVQRVACSAVAALFVAALMIGAAVPVLPVA